MDASDDSDLQSENEAYYAKLKDYDDSCIELIVILTNDDAHSVSEIQKAVMNIVSFSLE